MKKMSEVEGEIKQGNILFEGLLCRYTTWKRNKKEYKLISSPSGNLITFVDGKEIRRQKFDAKMWEEAAKRLDESIL